MQRINIIGTSGSGKTAFSKQLAKALAYPHYEMDAMFWKSNWTKSTDPQLFAAITAVTEQENWVLDGNYNRTIPVKWAHVDTVIWLDYSLRRTLFQAVRRALSRSLHRQELWQGTGNRESFRKNFMSRDSIILWTLRTYRSNQRYYQQLMHTNTYQHIKFIRLSCPKQTSKFIAELNH
ncbi:adenylate kinase [Agarivorans sp. QJM3NY_25]|uniref:adenylate kinase n=1 Tax=Agarivorans sp. QJM3NY_25 TaxID=3421430 RepID=UPI003D7DDDD3